MNAVEFVVTPYDQPPPPDRPAGCRIRGRAEYGYGLDPFADRRVPGCDRLELRYADGDLRYGDGCYLSTMRDP